MKKVNSIILILAAACACQQYSVTEHEGYDVMTQRRGPALGYSEVNIIYSLLKTVSNRAGTSV
jgi:hypothetical protein